MPTEEHALAETPVFFTGEFKRNVRQLAKKYRRIKADIQPILDTLAAGQTPGDQIPGVPFDVYKVRARNTDSARGKSGGYRIIYQRTMERTIILITLYSKTEQADVTPQDIQQIITTYEAEPPVSDSTQTVETPHEDEAPASEGERDVGNF